jgi:tRNA-specific 2-thiouridylase
MDRVAFEEHLNHPHARGGPMPDTASGTAGGAPCGDMVRISLRVEESRVTAVSFDASGCGSAVAAGSAAASLVDGASVLDAALVGPAEISQELGELSAGKFHAAELAAEALARALGAAVMAAPPALADSRRVLVAMSGGVDSAVAALLCRDAPDCEPVAVTLELWRDPEGDAEASCCSASAVVRARRVARAMGIPHLTLDLREEFGREVVTPWLSEHREGRTPNPCIRCNGSLRLDAMLDLARSIGARGLATGHYARVGGGGELLCAIDSSKDQSFMLAGLEPSSLARLEFPLGEMTKEQVRRTASAAGLEVAATPDSQDLCFLAGVGRESFLARFGEMNEREGEILDVEGRVIGRHRGAHRFTVGQRRGLEIGGLDEPLYVLETDTRRNTVTAGPASSLRRQEIAVTDVRLRDGAERVATVRLRSHAPAVACRLEGDQLLLRKPVLAPAPGQTAVFLDGDRVVGCATIA